MAEVMKIMETSLKRSMCTLLYSFPWPCNRSPLTHASAEGSWTLMGKSGSVSVGSLLLSPGSGVHKVLFVAAKILFPQSCVSSSGSVVS